MNFEFYDAIDGSKMTRQMLKGTKLFQTGLPYTAGAYGAASSHLNLWEEAINLGKPVTVVEDDAILRLDFKKQYEKSLETLPPDWDFVLWGWDFNSIISLRVLPNISPVNVTCSQAMLRKSVNNFRALKEDVKLLRLDKCFGIPAYSISPRGAEKFRSLCFPLVKFRMRVSLLKGSICNDGIDIAMSRVFKATNSFCCLPPLAITKNEQSKSQIQNNKFVTR